MSHSFRMSRAACVFCFLMLQCLAVYGHRINKRTFKKDDVRTFVAEWTVVKPGELPLEPEEWIGEKGTISSSDGPLSWELRLYPRGLDVRSEGAASLGSTLGIGPGALAELTYRVDLGPGEPPVHLQSRLFSQTSQWQFSLAGHFPLGIADRIIVNATLRLRKLSSWGDNWVDYDTNWKNKEQHNDFKIL